MNGRNRRGNRRQANMKARIGIATAVLVGGGAVGVAAIATASHGPATTTTQNDAFSALNFRHHLSEQAALSSAFSTWGWSHQRSLTTLAQMVPMRTFAMAWGHHHTQYAAQRGVVEAVGNVGNKQFLLVKSANGKVELWWANGNTVFQNVAASPVGMTAMTGNTSTAQQMANNNIAPAAATMAGSTAMVNQMAAPVVKPIKITLNVNGQTITIIIRGATASATTPTSTPSATATGTMAATPTATATMTATPTATGTMTATPTATATGTATSTAMATATPTMTATQPATTTAIARGDLVLIAGVRSHGRLTAQLVLFSAPTTVTPTPTGTATVTPTATATSTGTATTPTGTATSTPTFSGVGS
jgi:hypothetical protein